jgi:O-antigen/teichoic acid export membrane protein
MFRNILQLMTGNGLAQLIQFASIPILTQFYSPENFGYLALAIAISGILAVISSLQLHVGIVTLKSTRAVNYLLATGIVLNALMIFISVLLVFIVDVFIYNHELSLFFILLVVLNTFFSSVNNLLKGVYVYSGTFSKLSTVLIVRAIAIVTLQFWFAWQFTEAVTQYGLVLGLLFGEIILFILIGFNKIKIRDVLTLRVFKRLSFFLKKLKAFVVYGTPQELVSVAIFWMPLVIVSATLGEEIAGQYSISARILWPATILVTGSIAQVLYHRMVNMPIENLIELVFFRAYFKLIYIPLALLAYYVSPFIFELVLDDTWQEAKNISKYVALLCVVFLYALPYRVVYRVLKIQKMLLIIEILTLCVLILITALVDYKTIDDLLRLLVLLGVFQSILLEYFCRKSLLVKIKKIKVMSNV